MIARSNYLWTQAFLKYLQEVKGLQATSAKRYRYHLNHVLLWADSTRLCEVQTKRPTLLQYVMHLTQAGKPLSQETRSRILETAKRFYLWGSTHLPADFRKVQPAWIDTLQLPKSPSHSAENVYVSLAEIMQIANLAVAQTDLVMQRDRAAAVMLFLSGMRAGAFVSAPRSAFDLEQQLIYQWPAEYGVKTKNGKQATTYLLPIPELLEVVGQWHTLISAALPAHTPWYAPILSKWGAQSFSATTVGNYRATNLNKRLKLLFQAAELPCKSAHAFRHGHAVYGLQHAKSQADYKAVSMNLMHHNLSITDSIYAPLLGNEVQTRIAGLTPASTPSTTISDRLTGLPDNELASVFREVLRQSNK